MAPLTARRMSPSSRTSRKRKSPEASVPTWTVKLCLCIWREANGFKSMSLPLCIRPIVMIIIGFSKTEWKWYYQMFNLIQELMHFVAISQSDMRFAQQSPHFAFQLRFIDIDHHHKSHQVIKQRWKQSIFFVFQSLPFRFAQRFIPNEQLWNAWCANERWFVIPFHHFTRSLTHPD